MGKHKVSSFINGGDDRVGLLGWGQGVDKHAHKTLKKKRKEKKVDFPYTNVLVKYVIILKTISTYVAVAN